jgi:hypothetical protein
VHSRPPRSSIPSIHCFNNYSSFELIELKKLESKSNDCLEWIWRVSLSAQSHRSKRWVGSIIPVSKGIIWWSHLAKCIKDTQSCNCSD